MQMSVVDEVKKKIISPRHISWSKTDVNSCHQNLSILFDGWIIAIANLMPNTTVQGNQTKTKVYLAYIHVLTM